MVISSGTIEKLRKCVDDRGLDTILDILDEYCTFYFQLNHFTHNDALFVESLHSQYPLPYVHILRQLFCIHVCYPLYHPITCVNKMQTTQSISLVWRRMISIDITPSAWWYGARRIQYRY